MRKIYTADNLITLTHLKNVLEADGIECLLRNQFLSGALGDIPATECWPELWIRNNIDWLRARELLAAQLHSELAPGASWSCAACGETLDGQFDACWQCGMARAGA